jgi:tRNA(Ile)-lysidine synthase
VAYELQPGERCLVACSGGADSTALVVWLREQFPESQLVVASVDHGLRGEAGARDVARVAKMAESMGLEFHPLEVALGGSGVAGSVEGRAREARYAALAALADELGIARIATGHTLDDQAETVWMRHRRGAGPRGLAAMAAERPLGNDGPGAGVTLWRPLLHLRRRCLRTLLKKRGIAWSEDATNEDRRFTRNRVRHDELPALGEVVALDGDALVRALGRLAGAARTLVETEAQLLAPRDDLADTAVLRCLPLSLRRGALAAQYAAAGGDAGNLTRAHLARVLRVVKGDAVAASLPGLIEARRSKGVLVFQPVQPREQP